MKGASAQHPAVLIRAVLGVVDVQPIGRTPHTRQSALVVMPIPEDDNDVDALIHDR